MVTTYTWQAQTMILVSRVESEIKEAQERLANLEEERRALVRALTSYSERMGGDTVGAYQPLTPADVKNKSYIEILKLVAERNHGLLVVQAAIQLLKDANVFGDSINIPGMVYTILRRSKDFVKVGKGVYKTNGHHRMIEGKKVRNRHHTPSTGLADKIGELLQDHPEWKPKDLHAELQRQQWNFGGKNSSSAVGMAYALNLKRRKNSTQPKLAI